MCTVHSCGGHLPVGPPILRCFSQNCRKTRVFLHFSEKMPISLHIWVHLQACYSTLFSAKMQKNARKSGFLSKKCQFLCILQIPTPGPILRYFRQKVAKTRVLSTFLEKNANFLHISVHLHFAHCYSCTRSTSCAGTSANAIWAHVRCV